jgi:hypothetical protein
MQCSRLLYGFTLAATIMPAISAQQGVREFTAETVSRDSTGTGDEI